MLGRVSSVNRACGELRSFPWLWTGPLRYGGSGAVVGAAVRGAAAPSERAAASVVFGAEAAELGARGAAVVAQAVGVAPDTVRRGRREAQGLDTATVVRSRRPGGGRKKAEEHDPDLVAALEALIDPVTCGDPISPLRWTSKSTRTLARTLTENGHKVSKFVVRRPLGERGYSLQANAKTTEGAQHSGRDPPVRLPQHGVYHVAAEPAGSMWVSPTTPPSSRWPPSSAGGPPWAPPGTPRHRTADQRRWRRLHAYRIRMSLQYGGQAMFQDRTCPPWPPAPACGSPCATSRRAPASGTRSNTACFPTSR